MIPMRAIRRSPARPSFTFDPNAELVDNVREYPLASLEGFAIRSVDVDVLDGGDPDFVNVRVRISPDADAHGESHQDPTVTLVRPIPRKRIGTPIFRDLVREVVMLALRHEVDEWLAIAGEIVDPHTGIAREARR